MTTQRKLKHGSTAQRMSVTPVVGQIGSDDDEKRVYLGDGSTVGGIGMAKKSEVDAIADPSKLPEDIYTSDHTVTAADRGRMMVGNKATTINFPLPAISGADEERYYFRNIGAGDQVIDPNSAEQIEGASTLVLKTGESASVWPNEGETAWRATVWLSADKAAARTSLGLGYANDAEKTAHMAAIGIDTGGAEGDIFYRSSAGLLAKRTKGAVGTILRAGTSQPGYEGALAPDIILQDQKSAGTDGGTFTTGAWRTRVLNTEVIDTNSWCTLSSNQFTLSAGSYYIEWSAPALAVNVHKTRLRNVTDGSTVVVGTSEYANPTYIVSNRSEGCGTFTIAASKALEIQHNCGATQNTNGFGSAANLGEAEIYTIVKIWRIG